MTGFEYWPAFPLSNVTLPHFIRSTDMQRYSQYNIVIEKHLLMKCAFYSKIF